MRWNYQTFGTSELLSGHAGDSEGRGFFEDPALAQTGRNVCSFFCVEIHEDAPVGERSSALSQRRGDFSFCNAGSAYELPQNRVHLLIRRLSLGGRGLLPGGWGTSHSSLDEVPRQVKGVAV
jgi:hypothetical protein